jgi:elongator complex protein 1
MSIYDLSTDSEIIDVALNSPAGILATLHQRCINAYTYITKNRKSAVPNSKIEIALPAHCGTPYQIAVNKQGIVVVLSYDPEDGEQLFSCDLEVEPELSPLTTEESFLGGTSNLCHSVDQKDIYVQDKLGQILPIIGDSVQPQGVPLRLPEQCPWAEVVTTSETFSKTIPFGLSESGVLFAKSKVLSQNCTSFLVTQSHLIFTTSNHLLKFVHLTANDGKLNITFQMHQS